MELWMLQVNVLAFWKLLLWPQCIATSQIQDKQVPVQTIISWKCKKGYKTRTPNPVFMVCISSTSMPQLFHPLSSWLVSVLCVDTVDYWAWGAVLKPTMSKNVSHEYSMSHSCRTWCTACSFSLDGSNSAVSVMECTFTQVLSSNTVFQRHQTSTLLQFCKYAFTSH